MDLERGLVEALFYDCPLEKVVKIIEENNAGNKVDIDSSLIFISDLMKTRMPHFDGKELRQFLTEVKRNCENDFADFDWKLWPLLYVSKVGSKFLRMEHRRPVVSFEEVLRWRALTLDVGEDLLSLSWLAMIELNRKDQRTDFAWEDTLLTDENSFKKLVRQRSFTDLHAHIGHSSDAFNIRWTYWMNNCWDRPKMKDERKLLCIAAIIRFYIFQIVTNGGCPSDDIICDVLEARESKTTLQNLHDEIYGKFDAASSNSMVPNIDGIEHWDYAIQQSWRLSEEVRSSPFMLLAGERWLVYSFFKRLYKGESDAVRFAMLFYLYLLIKVDWRKQYIPTNGLIGLSNYQEYEDADRDDEIHSFKEPKRRYAVQSSLGARANNYLEARVSLNFDHKNNRCGDPQTLETEEIIESPLLNIRVEMPMFGNGKKKKKKTLMRKVGLVVTNSKKSYNVLRRAQYLHEKKEEIDRVIARYKRNKRLKDTDFCVVGVDFSSSDEYARPEVFAQLVRYARNKGFNRFTYHAGEDFYDLIDGLRTIEDILVFLKWDRHCRLGHVIALGINAREYYKNRGRNVIATRQTLLDNLAWLLAKLQRLNFPLPNATREALNIEIERLYKDIGYAAPFDLKKYQQSMSIRGDFPQKGIMGEGITPFNECAVDPNPELQKVRLDKEVKTLFEDYCYDELIRSKGGDIIHWKMPEGVEKGIETIQKQLLDEIKEKGIAIESCPTSNLIIGPFNRYDELPLNSFWRSLPDNHISINTDDKGVMATSIEAEYVLMAASMAKNNVPEADIRARLDRTIKDARASKFDT